MKALFIGGTGIISTDVSQYCVNMGWNLTLLNRGHSMQYVPQGAKCICADIQDEPSIAALLKTEKYDVVADFIAYTPEDVLRDIRLFQGKTKQYIFISSISAYQKPPVSPWLTESTPLVNPYWDYSQQKIACEQILMEAYRKDGFPVTIVRPGHTYCRRKIPVAMQGRNGSFQVVERIRTGKRVIVPGDGSSLWTFTHARDFAAGFEGLMGNVHALGEAYHITSDEKMCWNQAYECIGSALGVKPQLVHIASDTLASLSKDYLGGLIGDKSHSILLDNSKIKRAVPKFCATIRYDQGVEEAAHYIYAHPECQTPDPVFDAWCDQVIEAYERLASALPLYPENE